MSRGSSRNATLRKELGISETHMLVTVRPPATEAHYHNPESDKLLSAALNFLTKQHDVRVPYSLGTTGSP